MTTDILKVNQSNSMPSTLKLISTTSNGTTFYNLYGGSLLDHAQCCVTFKMDENPPLKAKALKKKEQGEYIVNGCIRFMGYVMKKTVTGLNSPLTRTLQDRILRDTTGHMPLII